MSAVAPLRHRRAAELAAPDDQRVVEQAALLQVGDERPQLAGRSSLGTGGRDVASARSPWWSQSRVIELHEAHAALDQPAGQQAVVGEASRASRRRRRTARACSPAPRQMSISSGTLVCMRNAISYWRDARGDLRVAASFGMQLELSSPMTSSWRAARPRRCRRGWRRYSDRVALAPRAARPGSPPAGSRCPRCARSRPPRGRSHREHHDEAGQVVRLRCPGRRRYHAPDAGPAGNGRAGLKKIIAGA